MPQRTTLALTLALIIIIAGGVYFWQQKNEAFRTDEPVEADQDSTTQTQTYSDEHYSFEYPQDYEITKKTAPERVEVVGDNARLSIFQLKSPTGERVTELGFGGAAPENIPKKLKVVENEHTWFDVWFYYAPDDTAAEKDLMAIYESIELK